MASIGTRSQEFVDALRRGIWNYWYPILPSDELPADRPLGIKRLGANLVVWRDADGVPHTFVDRCAHRAARLSIGDVVDGRLQCRYHGLQYDGTGQCRLVPMEQQDDGPQARRLCVASYPTVEQDGAVWAYLGDTEIFPPGPVPAHEEHPELADPSFEWIVRSTVWRANWLLVHDNTADLFHFPFLHGHYGVHSNPDSRPALEPLPPRNPLVTDVMAEALAFDKYETTASANSVYTRRVGHSDGTTIDDVEFVIPCSANVWVPVPDGGHLVRSIQYEMPIDADETQVVLFIGRKVDDETERGSTRELLSTFCWDTFSIVFAEDSWIVENQVEVDEAFEHESPLPTDTGPVRLRKLLGETYQAQQARITEHERANGGKRWATAGG